MELGLGHGYIAINKNTYFQCPSDTVAHSVFRDMAFRKSDRREIDEFLDLCSDCRSLIDVGASGGFFSVLFASSRSYSSTILSIEPDIRGRQVLMDLRSKNRRKNVDWQIDGRGVMEETKVVRFVSSGYGVEAMDLEAFRNAYQHAKANNLQVYVDDVQCTTLETIALDHAIVPDVIKIDIESYEYELITSSLNLLHEWRPRIMLELHVSTIERRGLNPRLILNCLASVGYKRICGANKDVTSLVDEVDKWGIVRAGLVS